MIKVTVWSEHVQDRGIEAFPPDSPLLQNPELREFLEFSAREIKKVHPNGLHNTLKALLEEEEDFSVRVATMEMPECGLTQEVLDDTDVLVWWAHVAHDQVPDEIAFRVRDAVWKGMGFIGLHSAHPSKPMQLLVGASGSLKWREGDRARVWCCNPTHPIAEGIPESFELENEEMYGEPFDIATPDELVVGPVKARVNGHLAHQQAQAREHVLEALNSKRYFALLDALDALVDDLAADLAASLRPRSRPST